MLHTCRSTKDDCAEFATAAQPAGSAPNKADGLSTRAVLAGRRKEERSNRTRHSLLLEGPATPGVVWLNAGVLLDGWGRTKMPNATTCLPEQPLGLQRRYLPEQDPD
jgi:hypothetical protein